MLRKYGKLGVAFAALSCITLLLKGPVLAEADPYIIKENVYVRPEKNSSKSLGILKKGQIITGVEDGAWFSFTYDGQEAYVAKALLEKGQFIELEDENQSEVSSEEEEESVEVADATVERVQAHTTSSLMVRPYPNAETSLGIVDKNFNLFGYQKGYWFHFTYKGQEACVAARFVEEGFYENQVEEPSEDATPLIIGYTTSDLYVRPSIGSSKSLGIIAKGVKVEGNVDGAWFRFEYEGQKAYIAKKFVSDQRSPEVGKPVQEEMFTSSKLFVRPYPNSEKKLGILPKEARIIGLRQGAWFEINYNGQKGYVAYAFLLKSVKPDEKPVEKPPVEKPAEESVEKPQPETPSNNHSITTTGDYYNVGITNCDLMIRPQPDSSESLGILPKGTRLMGVEQGAWVEFIYQGRKAYVAKAFLRYAPVIDISTHQKAKNIDYDQLAQNISAAILRVGYTGWGTGDFYDEDEQFKIHYEELKKRGIPVGAYWYSCANTPEKGKAEAEYMINIMKGMQFEYPVYWDVEDPTHQATASKEELTNAGISFLDTLEKSGYYVGIYASSSWFRERLDMNRLNRYDQWVAHYGVDEPNWSGDYGMWQYTDREYLPGYKGRLDANEVYKDYPSIIKNAGLNGY